MAFKFVLSVTLFVALSVKLVETRRHIVYNLVLLPSVATTNVERAFSAMSFVKNKLRNKMGDSLLDDYLVTFIESGPPWIKILDPPMLDIKLGLLS